MSYLHYENNNLFIEQTNLKTIAQQFGTPAYIYSKKHITENYQKLDQALEKKQHIICFAVKANSNLSVLKTLTNLGSGFDCVSKGEIYRALKAGANPQKIVFSGVGKSTDEIAYALDQNILCINVESFTELERINQIATEKGIRAPVGLRVNPNINPKTHPYIATGLQTSKFGIPIENCLKYCQKAHQFPGIQIIGISCHIGSQITQIEPFKAAINKIKTLYQTLKEQNIFIQLINIGGGIGVRYHDEKLFSFHEYANTILKVTQDLPAQLIVEPGRSIVANAGVLLTQVEYIKHDNPNLNPFAIVDAGMNDLMRPMLYDAKHNIQSLEKKPSQSIYDIVGPICESTDVFEKNIKLPVLKPSDFLAITDTGAYGFSMSSNYNTRPKACEIMVDGKNFYLIRKREKLQDLIHQELLDDFSLA